jgi:hypothetical protein
VDRPTKEHILREIRRVAAENDGVPAGRERFEALTGIRESAWAGRYWARWSDAIRDAGFEPNSWQSRVHDDDELLRVLALLIRDYGRMPTRPELRLRRRTDPAVPGDGVLASRLGNRDAQVARVIAFADANPEFADVAAICAPLLADVVRPDRREATLGASAIVTGVVYLIEMGEFFKIGRSNDIGRRSYELGVQLPERHEVAHVIETDDPSGIESYWHRRFAAQRANGEWFRLAPSDVAAFKRRSYM